MLDPVHSPASPSVNHNDGDDKKEKKKVERTKLNYEVVQEGQYGRHPKEFKGSMLFTSADTVHVLDKMGVRKEIFEHVDFDKHMLLYVCSGQKPTGGYGIVLKRGTVAVHR